MITRHMKSAGPKTGGIDPPRLFHFAVLAVYALGGAQRPVDTEDVAMKCRDLAPGLFSWQKYKDQINLELVRVSLSDAKKAKNGALVSGTGRDGWRLTASGLDWAAEAERMRQDGDRPSQVERQSRAGSIDNSRRRREHSRIMESDAWREWQDSRSVDGRSARTLYRVDEYTTNKMLGIKIARLRDLFKSDDSIDPFLGETARILLEGKPNDDQH